MGQAAVPLRIDKISVGGGVGLLVGIVVAAMLVELPVLRWPLGTVGAGLVFGAGLISGAVAELAVARRRRLSRDGGGAGRALSRGCHEGSRRSR